MLSRNLLKGIALRTKNLAANLELFRNVRVVEEPSRFFVTNLQRIAGKHSNT